MKAVLCSDWGKPSDLALAEVETPEPSPGHVRIAVAACGINFADLLMVAGKYQVRPPLPFSPGLEVAGRVDALGDGVTGLRIGDRVAAYCAYGGFAEAVVVPAGNCVPLSGHIDDVTAAGFMVAYGTSHVALALRAQLAPGEILLVHGASGGVGLTAVELGRHMGATVIATAGSDEKLELAATYGAEHLINYREEDFVARVKEITDGRGADVVYDPVGGNIFERSLRCTAWEGRILVIGFASGQIPTAPCNYLLVKNISVVGVHWGAYAERDPATLASSLSTLFGWHADGALRPHVSQTVPLERAGEGLQALADRRATGKVVVTMG
jgi:NADPH2:quinone reductase